MRAVVVIAMMMTAVAAVAEKQPFERYQSIIDRQMFGALPKGFDPTKLPSEVARDSGAAEKQISKEQEQLRSAIHFSVINVTPEGDTVVGFTDNSDPKMPCHYYLRVGESRNGWEVKAADPIAATMTVVKGEIEVSLSLGGNSAKDGGTSAARTAGSTYQAQSFHANAKPETQEAMKKRLGSLTERRRQRQHLLETEKAKAEEARLAREEKEAEEKQKRDAEQAANKEAIANLTEQIRQMKEDKKREAAEREKRAKEESATEEDSE